MNSDGAALACVTGVGNHERIFSKVDKYCFAHVHMRFIQFASRLPVYVLRRYAEAEQPKSSWHEVVSCAHIRKKLKSALDRLGYESNMFSIFDFFNIYLMLICGIAFLWFYYQTTYNYWRKLNIKYLESVPFLGNTYKTWLNLAPMHEVFDELYKDLYDEPFAGIYQFVTPVLFVKDPELVSAILIKDCKHFYDRATKILTKDKTVDPLSMHLFFTSGKRWKVLRQKMSPVFTSGKLKQMHDQMMACIGVLTEYVDERMDDKNSVDVGLKELFEKLTIDVIGTCAFGIECNSFKSNEKFGEMGRLALKPKLMLIVRLILASIHPRLGDWSKITVMRKETNDFFINLALDTIEYRRRNRVVRNDLLQLLMELQNSCVDPKFAVGDNNKILENEEFDELDIAANVFLFFVAGFDTSASTLSYCIYELALNQEIQEKLRSEVVQKKSESETLSYEMIRSMTYMDAVITETLRKYPPVQFLDRLCTEDYTIPGTNSRITAGTEVKIPVWSIQHDWRNYPNPEVFDPERFVGDKYSHHSGTFLSFGDGPRYCLGKRFADMEIKVTLSEMILKYNFRPCAKTEIPLKFKKGNGMLQSKCGTWISLVKRM